MTTCRAVAAGLHYALKSDNEDHNQAVAAELANIRLLIGCFEDSNPTCQWLKSLASAVTIAKWYLSGLGSCDMDGGPWLSTPLHRLQPPVHPDSLTMRACFAQAQLFLYDYSDVFHTGTWHKLAFDKLAFEIKDALEDLKEKIPADGAVDQTLMS